jgi:hypothetical protein
MSLMRLEQPLEDRDYPKVRSSVVFYRDIEFVDPATDSSDENGESLECACGDFGRALSCAAQWQSSAVG